MVTDLLVREWLQAGHQVKVGSTSRELPEGFPYPVFASPDWLTLARQMAWADVVVHQIFSLKGAWPVLLRGKPWVVGHHVWLGDPVTGPRNWRERCKFRLLTRARNLAPSRAIARALPGAVEVVGNPYHPQWYRLRPEIRRDGDFLWVGRMIPDKGLMDLLRAMEKLHEKGLPALLTIVGDGPERRDAENFIRAREWDQGDRPMVQFRGSQTPQEVAREMNRHRWVVIPSRWAEPFGMVALEGIASGCAIIGSDQGGLPEAIGPCGLTYPNGHVEALAARMATAFRDPSLAAHLLLKREEHLAPFALPRVADAYLRICEEAIAARSGQ